ncbi:SET methyltransferase domain containing protein [Nitzschia inconspicua]|uniref:SET methyltransferase domain containing protein n=1 Tax=Nitzschia inconspicua TaxID=303405 RepID=A0A9K3LQD6_9STRA|nr:SET methyltransferase domain containing protein [Nitzschia inconspicua]
MRNNLAPFRAATLLLLVIGNIILPHILADDAEEILSAKPLQQPEQWQNDLVNWLISKPNGYFSDKVLWTKTEMGYNMHAAEDIPKDTTLMIIPQAALITSDGTDEECITISKMMKEYEKGEASEFYPYIRYLFGGHEGGTSTGLLPTTWSEPAKDLLKQMVGTDLYPKQFEKSQKRILVDCQEFIDRKELESMSKETAQKWQDAFIFWVSRSWSDKMVPILDMINHRNGKWLNVESTTAHSGQDIRVYALRDIKKGEQLWNTYNECLDEDCNYGRIKYSYITQHILMDYGFVEAYPRRFIFHVDAKGTDRNNKQFLIVEIDEDPEDPTKRTFEWHFRKPTDAQLHWIYNQLSRLKDMEFTMEEGLKALPDGHEKDTILAFYLAYREAFQLAMVHKDDDVSDNTFYPELPDEHEEEHDHEHEEEHDEEDDEEEDGDEL